MDLIVTTPPKEWLEVNNVSLRAFHSEEIINGKEKGGLWNAVYLLYQGDCLEAQTSNRNRHQFSAPFYNAAKALIDVELAKASDDTTPELIEYLQQTATTAFLSGTGFRNSKRTKIYSDSDLQFLYDCECLLNEQDFDTGEITTLRTKAEIYRRIAETLGLSENHIKREILNLIRK